MSKITLTLNDRIVKLSQKEFDYLEELVCNDWNKKFEDEPEYKVINKICNKFYKLTTSLPEAYPY